MQGADINGLEAKIFQHIGSGSGDDAGEDYGQGLVSLQKDFRIFLDLVLNLHNI